jgi:hypothetical protein
VRKTKMCWVCGKQVGPKSYTPTFTYAVIRDAIGNEHPTHLVCAKDADGKLVRTEKFNDHQALPPS